MGENIWAVKKDVCDITSGGMEWRVQRGESFRPSLNACEGSKECPKRRRQKEEIILRDSLDLSNQGRGEMEGAMSLYQVAK